MSAHSTAVVKAFYDVCNRAYRDWRIHRILFDDNPRKKELERSEARHALAHFSILSQESFLLQIAKLHDPAIMQGHITLGIEYMVRYGGWDKNTEAKLQALQLQLDELNKKIRRARNKILSHNDLESILHGGIAGDFPDGLDDKYFKTLQEFVDIIYINVIGKASPFSVEARIAKGFLWFFREEACKGQPTHISDQCQTHHPSISPMSEALRMCPRRKFGICSKSARGLDALQDAGAKHHAPRLREASWSAAALRRFRAHGRFTKRGKPSSARKQC